MKFRTEKDCFHNNRYYEAGEIVDCDCNLCKEGKVSYFKKLVEDIEKMEEIVKTDFENAIDKIDEMLDEPKDEPKEDFISCKDCKAKCSMQGRNNKMKKCKRYTTEIKESRTKIQIVG